MLLIPFGGWEVIIFYHELLRNGLEHAEVYSYVYVICLALRGVRYPVLELKKIFKYQV